MKESMKTILPNVLTGILTACLLGLGSWLWGTSSGIIKDINSIGELRARIEALEKQVEKNTAALATPTPAKPKESVQAVVAIRSPGDGDSVPSTFLAEGTSEGIGTDQYIWIAVETDKIYPVERAATVDHNGHWRSNVVLGSQPGTYRLHAILLDQNSFRRFTEYRIDADATGVYPGLTDLPSGAEILATVQIVRNNP